MEGLPTCWGHGLDPWSGRILCARGQLSPETREATAVRCLGTAMKGSLHSLQLEKARTKITWWKPSAAKKKKYIRPRHYDLIKMLSWNFLGGPVVKTPLSKAGGPGLTLVRELRSCIWQSVAKKKKMLLSLSVSLEQQPKFLHWLIRCYVVWFFSTFLPCYLSELISYCSYPHLFYHSRTDLTIPEVYQEWLCFWVLTLGISTGLDSNVTVSLKPSLAILYKVAALSNITEPSSLFPLNFFLTLNPT